MLLDHCTFYEGANRVSRFCCVELVKGTTVSPGSERERQIDAWLTQRDSGIDFRVFGHDRLV
jgi:hypothetical protein